MKEIGVVIAFLGGDGERAAGNVVVAPLDGHGVLPSLLHHVTYCEMKNGEPGICSLP